MNAWKPILVGVAFLVSELWLIIACLQKRPKFSFGHESVHAWVRACISVCACMHFSVHVWVHAWVYICMHFSVHAF